MSVLGQQHLTRRKASLKLRTDQASGLGCPIPQLARPIVRSLDGVGIDRLPSLLALRRTRVGTGADQSLEPSCH